MKSKPTIDTKGNKEWTLPDGLKHREDGPAIEWSDCYRAWYINGIEYTEQEYKIEIRTRKLNKLLQ